MQTEAIALLALALVCAQASPGLVCQDLVLLVVVLVGGRSEGAASQLDLIVLCVNLLSGQGRGTPNRMALGLGDHALPKQNSCPCRHTFLWSDQVVVFSSNG